MYLLNIMMLHQSVIIINTKMAIAARHAAKQRYIKKIRRFQGLDPSHGWGSGRHGMATYTYLSPVGYPEVILCFQSFYL